MPWASSLLCDDVRSPWQKGWRGGAIGRLRRPLPRKTRLADLSEAAFTQIIQLYNNTPPKCLGYSHACRDP